MKLNILPLVVFLSSCVHLASEPGVPVVLYEKVAEAFVMVVRADAAENGETTWGQASGCADPCPILKAGQVFYATNTCPKGMRGVGRSGFFAM